MSQASPDRSGDDASPPPGAASGEPVEQARAALAHMGAPEALAGPLVETLGAGAGAEITEDPWRLLALPRVTVEQADYCARRLLDGAPAPDDPRRARAVVAHVLHRAARDGHTIVEERRLATAVRSMGVESPESALAAAVDGGEIVVFEDLDDTEDLDVTDIEDLDGEGSHAALDDTARSAEPERAYSPTRVGLAEQGLGERIARLAGTSEPIMDSATAAETVAATARRIGAEITPETTAAVVTLALRGVCVLRHTVGGAAAVAHAVAAAADIASESETGIAVATPTTQAAVAVNAALRRAGADQVEAVPLARLLECRGPGEFGRHRDRPVEAGLVVATDAMALDVERAAALADACADGTHLVLVADPAQAPSAGPGQVVADLVASRTVAVADLPDGPDPGPLARLCAMVADGELGTVDSPEREVVVTPASGDDAAHRAVQLLTDSIPRALEIRTEQAQVVASSRGGEAGVDALNTACKARLNPGPGAHGGFDLGDRVLLTSDGPGYSAGDVGYLRAAGDDGFAVKLADGTAPTVAQSSRLRPGWAISVAAAHGGHWPAVVAVFGPAGVASRPQVYTALSRPARHLSVVHAAGADLARAVRGTPSITRTTRLTRVLREA